MLILVICYRQGLKRIRTFLYARHLGRVQANAREREVDRVDFTSWQAAITSMKVIIIEADFGYFGILTQQV